MRKPLRHTSRFRLFMLPLSCCLLIPIPRSEAGSLLPKDANLLVQQEAAMEALGLIGALVGTGPPSALPWSGTISDSGWSLSMSATSYLGGTLTMSYSGSLDQSTNVDSWNGTTTFATGTGSLTLTSMGSYTNALGTTNDGDWLDVFKIVAIGAVTAVGDVLVVGVQGATTVGSAGTLGPGVAIASVGAIGSITAAGAVGISNVGKDNKGKETGSNKQSSLTPPYVPPYPLPFPNPPGLPSPAILVASSGQLSGNYSNPSVSISGNFQISTIPEPTSSLLLGLGMVGVLGYAGWRRRH